MPWVPSSELSALLMELSRKQRWAVLRIVQAEADCVPLIRLLKTPYSCRWCGLRVGETGMRRDDRKALLAKHETSCERKGETWRFVCTLRNYYGKWHKDADFLSALALARDEVQVLAVTSAVMGLQAGTQEAVAEVRRLIREGESEANRLRAAFGLLDRAGVETAPKATRTHAGQVDYVDVTEGELAAIEDALRQEAEGGGETE